MIIQITKKYTGKLRLNIQLSIFGLFPNSILQLLTQFMGLGILESRKVGGKGEKKRQEQFSIHCIQCSVAWCGRQLAERERIQCKRLGLCNLKIQKEHYRNSWDT